MTDEEQYIHECLRRLQEQYYKDAEPYMKRLAQLKYLESPTLLIDANTWALLHPSEITGGSTEMTDTPLFTAPQAQQPAMSKDQVREVFMAHGFTIKDGQTDLKQYVYDAAYALLGQQPAPVQEPVAWVWNPAKESWEQVHMFGHWQQGAIYAFGPEAPQAQQPQLLTDEIESLRKRYADSQVAAQLALDALGPEPPECCGCQEEWRIAIDALKGVLK